MFDIWNSLTSSSQNEFLSGGLVLMVLGSLVALCRKLPKHAWDFLVRRLTVVIDVSNDDPLFSWLSLWLSEHPYSTKARALTATTERDEYGRVSGDSGGENTLPQVLLTPAPGNHLLRCGRRLVWMSRDREDTKPSSNSDSLLSLLKRETFTLRVIGRDRTAAKKILDDARNCALTRRKKKVEVFTASYDYWQSIDELDPRPLSTVYLPEGTVEDVVDDVEKFLKARTWYTKQGIPWRRRYLFYGVPRSGKTSLICALAGHFKMNLYVLNLGGPYLSDDSLLSLMSKVPSRSFILLEDIDCAFNGRDKSDDTRNKLTFSGLLNALDGVGSKQGSLIFMTTNHFERLDAALVGAGRADYKLNFESATAEQANRMFRTHFPQAEGADGFGSRVEDLGWSMADVQNHLLSNKDSIIQALNLPETRVA